MFSGLGNFPDLNSTFAQLSNFSLDALQSGETEDGNKGARTGALGQANDVQSSQSMIFESPVPKGQDISNDDNYTVNSQMKKLQEENSLLTDRARAFEEHVQHQDKDLRRMRESAAQTESAHANALRQVQEERNRLQCLCEELQHKTKFQETEISILSREKKSENDEEDDSSVNPLDEIVATLKVENARLSEKAQMFEEKYSSSDSQLQDLQAQLRDVERAHEEIINNLKDDFSHQQKHAQENHSNQVKSLQEELVSLSKKLENTQKRAEINASSLESILQEAENRFNRQQEEWRNDFETKEKEYQAAMQILEKQKEELQQKIGSTEKECDQKVQNLLIAYQNEISQLQSVSHSALEESHKHDHENSELLISLQSNISILQQKLQQKEKSLQDLLAELELAKETHQSVIAQLAQTQEDNMQKSTQNEDLTNKVQVLTDKMRELVQRHSELKSKASTMQQDKESEVIKLQLKFDSQREQFEEQRFKLQEISERYSAVQKLWSEAQREQQRWEDEKHHLETRVQEMQGHLEEKESALSSLEITKKRIEDDLSALLRESERKYSLLSEEFRKFQEQSGNNVEHAQALENYKRRSQLALKKANSAAAILQEENAQLQQQLLSTQKDMEMMRETEENTHKTVQILEEEKALLTTQLSLWETEKQSLVQQISDLHAKLDQLQTTCEQLQYKLHQQQQHNEHSHIEIPVDTTLFLEKAILSSDPPVTATTTNNNAEFFSQEPNKSFFSQLPQQSQTQQIPPPTLSSPHSLVSPTDTNPAALDEDVEIVRVLSSNTNDDYFTTAVIQSPAMISHQSINNHHQHLPSTNSNNNVVLSTSSSTASGFILVDELQQQVHSLQRQIAQRSLECDETVHMLRKEKEEKEKLAQRCEELAAFLSRARKSDNAGNSAIVSNAGSTVGFNLDYLKQVVFKFVTASEHSERSRLLPVLCALLSFTPKEKQQATAALEQWQSSVDSVLGITATNVEAISSAFSWLGGLTGTNENASSNHAKK